ncbi:MAG: PEP-CTERM sorting domain-containing protein [Akkermansia sp.]|nr:PEP-CTERM sorting domain-containing protein [Akkermansia sp.]
MKRNISFICTFALSMSISFGIELDSADKVSDGSSIDVTSNRFTVAITLDVNAFSKLLKKGNTPDFRHNVVLYTPQASVSTNLLGVTINGSSANSKITQSGLYARFGGDAAYKINNAYVRWDGGTDLSTIPWDDVSYAGLTYMHYGLSGASYSAVAFTLMKSDGTAIVEAYYKAAGLGVSSTTSPVLSFGDEVIGVYYYEGFKTEAEGKQLASLAARAIPEPTTATLSLLALAGLMGRRRRKTA